MGINVFITCINLILIKQLTPEVGDKYSVKISQWYEFSWICGNNNVARVY